MFVGYFAVVLGARRAAPKASSCSSPPSLPRHPGYRLGLLAFCVIALAGCPGDAPEETDTRIMNFRSSQLRLLSASDTIDLRVEIAATDDERAVGLMERRSLPDDQGMIFLYPETQPRTAAFWMFRTRIPLDIAFIDSLGTIRAINRMEPCDSPMARGCPTYPAGVPFRAALEVNRGWFNEHSVGVGDRVLLEDITPATALQP